MNEQDKSSLAQHDHEMHWRCPQLGGEVPFRYCRTVNAGRPCARTVPCWHTIFDVRTFLARHYDLDEIQASERPRPDKIVQLAELVHRTAEKP